LNLASKCDFKQWWFGRRPERWKIKCTIFSVMTFDVDPYVSTRNLLHFWRFRSQLCLWWSLCLCLWYVAFVFMIIENAKGKQNVFIHYFDWNEKRMWSYCFDQPTNRKIHLMCTRTFINQLKWISETNEFNSLAVQHCVTYDFNCLWLCWESVLFTKQILISLQLFYVCFVEKNNSPQNHTQVETLCDVLLFL